jgi:hypothetical protein
MREHSIEAISVDESKRLIALEQTIKQGLDTFVEVGEALLEIRDSRLYRIEHGTFEEYCKGKWGMSIRHADRLMIGAKAVDAIKQSGPIGLVPQAESQARPLTKLRPEDQPKAWQKAVEIAGGEQPTAKQVSQAVVEISKADETPNNEIMPTQEPQKIAKLPKYKPDLAMQIAQHAISMLDTIVKQDLSREAALEKVIAYCRNRIDIKK